MPQSAKPTCELRLPGASAPGGRLACAWLVFAVLAATIATPRARASDPPVVASAPKEADGEPKASPAVGEIKTTDVADAPDRPAETATDGKVDAGAPTIVRLAPVRGEVRAATQALQPADARAAKELVAPVVARSPALPGALPFNLITPRLTPGRKLTGGFGKRLEGGLSPMTHIPNSKSTARGEPRIVR